MATLNLQVGVGTDDGYSTSADGFWPADAGTYIGEWAAVLYESWFRFTGVSGLSGVTINSASYQLKGSADSVGNPLTKVFAEDAAAPVAPTDADDHQAKPRTTAGVDWDWFPVNNNWASKDIKTIIQELADSYDPSAIQILHDDDGSDDDYAGVRTFEVAAGDAAKLDIDYTVAGIGADEMMAAIGGGGGGGGGGSGDIMAHSRKPPEAIAY